MKSGIYMIKNKINGKKYIGSSNKIEKRVIRHVRELNNNIHHNIYLQRSWDKYGEDNFEFKVIETCSQSELLELEQRYLDKIFESDDYNSKYYNIGKMSSGGDNITNHPNLDEIRIKHSKNGIERYASLSDEEKKTISMNNMGVKNPNYGNKWSDEQKEMQSIKLKKFYNENDNYIKGKTWSEYHGIDKAKELSMNMSEVASKRIGEKNPFYGKKHSEETKMMWSKSKIGKKTLSVLKPFKINGKPYLSLMDAQKELGIHFTTVRHRIKSNNIKFSDYVYITDEEELSALLKENEGKFI